MQAELRSPMSTETTTDPVEQGLADLLKSVSEPEGALLRKAFEYAQKAHAGQKRLSGEPYIIHPLQVAKTLVELRLDAPTIAAALLHDVLEDNTAITYDHLKAEFDTTIANLVQGVTKLTRITFDSDSDQQGENLRRLILAMAKDIRVVVIKLCDRLHNMRTLEHLAEDRRQAIARETIAIYAPLAHRLGMTRFRTELEDLAMYWLYPEDYRLLQQNINKRRHEREALINEVMDFLRLYLRVHYPDVEIQGRPKHFFSIWRKMKTLGLSFDEIYDLNAVRIICDTETQCYDILGLIHAIWPPIPNRFKDYIGMPKANMYQSLHTTVIGLHGEVTEIQIRTRRMHAVAEEGIAAHWHYKEGGTEIDNKLNERLLWLRRAMEWITDLKKPTEFLEAIKKDVFADVVICFTPKGDLIELPAGATPLDFAYAVHSKVGEHCIGARVNRKQVPTNTKLHTGDVVEIQTQNSGHPSRDWLDIVVTSRARSKIKRWLKDKEFDIWVNVGKEMVAEIVKNRNIEISREELLKLFEKTVQMHRLSSTDELFCEIGFGSLSAQKVINQTLPPQEKKVERPAKRTVAKPNEIIIEGGHGVSVHHAACCNPRAGDEIVGFVTRGRGVTIHKINCPNIVRMRSRGEADAQRLLPAYWASEHVNDYRQVVLHVFAHDHAGLLNIVSGLITEAGIFITSCSSRSNIKKKTAVMNFTLRVRSNDDLDHVLKSIRKIRAVMEVSAKEKGKNHKKNGDADSFPTTGDTPPPQDSDSAA